MTHPDASSELERLRARVAELEQDLARSQAVNRQLREADRRFRSLLDNVNLLAVGIDREGRLAYANRYFFELSGYSSQEALGRDWFESFVPKSCRPTVNVVFSDILEAALPVHYENPILTRAGEERLVRWNNTLLLDAAGHPEGTLSIGEDITARRRAEARLRASEEHHRAVVDTAADAIITVDDKGIVQSLNRAAERLFGYAAPEVVGSGLSMLIPAAGRDTEASFLSARLADAAEGPHQLPGMRRDGAALPLELTLHGQHEKGQQHYTVIVRRLSRLSDEGPVSSERAPIQQDLASHLANLSRRIRDARAVTAESATARTLDAMLADAASLQCIIDSLAPSEGPIRPPPTANGDMGEPG